MDWLSASSRVTESAARVRDLLMAYLAPRRKGNHLHLKYCRQAAEQQRVLIEECSLPIKEFDKVSQDTSTYT